MPTNEYTTTITTTNQPFTLTNIDWVSATVTNSSNPQPLSTSAIPNEQGFIPGLYVPMPQSEQWGALDDKQQELLEAEADQSIKREDIFQEEPCSVCEGYRCCHLRAMKLLQAQAERESKLRELVISRAEIGGDMYSINSQFTNPTNSYNALYEQQFGGTFANTINAFTSGLGSALG